MALANTLEFPSISPDGFPVLAREPVFDPARHLALEHPDRIVTLRDLGYSPEEIAACPTELGITSCFRVLSDEGVACLLEVARSLAPYIRGVERISRMVRGGAYQSRFLRDLCRSPDVAHWISEICGAPMIPVVGLAFVGLSSTTLTLFAQVSTYATIAVIGGLTAGVLYLAWRTGDVPSPSQSR